MPSITSHTFSPKIFPFLGFLFTTAYFSYKVVKRVGSLRMGGKVGEGPRRVKTEFSDYYFDKNLEIEMVEEEVGKNASIEDIYLQSSKISREEFIKYTQEIRRRRRLIRKLNEQQYVELILTYENEVQQLLTRNRLELASYLHLSDQDLFRMEENYDAVEDLHLLHQKSEKLLRQQLIKFGPHKKMSLPTLQALLNQQIAFVKTKIYERIKNQLSKEVSFTQNQILAVITALQDDIVYEHFGYERQDIERKIEETKIDVTQRNKYQAMLQADVVTFNYQSLENSDLEDEQNGELKGSLPTLGFSTEIKGREE